MEVADVSPARSVAILILKYLLLLYGVAVVYSWLLFLAGALVVVFLQSYWGVGVALASASLFVRFSPTEGILEGLSVRLRVKTRWEKFAEEIEENPSMLPFSQAKARKQRAALEAETAGQAGEDASKELSAAAGSASPSAIESSLADVRQQLESVLSMVAATEGNTRAMHAKLDSTSEETAGYRQVIADRLEKFDATITGYIGGTQEYHDLIRAQLKEFRSRLGELESKVEKVDAAITEDQTVASDADPDSDG